MNSEKIMNHRPKRKIIPSSLLKEYIITESEKPESNKDKNSFPLKNSSVLISGLKLNTGKSKKQHRLNSNDQNKKNFPNLKLTPRNELTSNQSFKDKGSFLCEECGKSLSSLQAFAEHSNIHKNIKPYKCEICGRLSRQWSVHFRHLLTHDKNTQKFSCTVCSKSFRTKVYLKFHLGKHLDDVNKPYTCCDCSKSFITKRDLDRHVISHSSILPFACPHCQKKFKFKHNLQAHLKAHLGKQSWKCHICQSNFPQNSLLKAHQRDHKEIIQNVELTKLDCRTINVITFPLDRRKVAQAQKVELPQHLSLDNWEGLKKSKLSLCLNDVAFPLSVVANAFGTGKFITVKIIDPKNKSSDSCIVGKQPIKAFLSGTDSDLKECTTKENELISDACSSSNREEMDFHQLLTATHDKKLTELEDLIKIFEDKVDLEGLNEETFPVVKNLSSIMTKFDFPLPPQVCKHLNCLITHLQSYLIENELQTLDKFVDDSTQPTPTDSSNISNEIFSEKNSSLSTFQNGSDFKNINSYISPKRIIQPNTNDNIKTGEKRVGKTFNKSCEQPIMNLFWYRIHSQYQILIGLFQKHLAKKIDLVSHENVIKV